MFRHSNDRLTDKRNEVTIYDNALSLSAEKTWQKKSTRTPKGRIMGD